MKNYIKILELPNYITCEFLRKQQSNIYYNIEKEIIPIFNRNGWYYDRNKKKS